MMQDDIRTPRHKKPVKIRKPSQPLDGINHRLLREQAAAQAQQTDEFKPDDTEPTREELEAKAAELGIRFDGRTSGKKLNSLIEAKLK
jgi:hypothetical protein